MSEPDVLRWLTNGAFVGLAAVALAELRRRRTPAAAWMAATCTSLGLVVIVGLLLPENPEGFAQAAAVKGLIAVLVLFPYCLYRFSAAFGTHSRQLDVVAGVLAFVSVAWTVALPELPSPDEPRSEVIIAYTVYVLGAWVLLSVVVAVHMWRAGRGEPRIARQRMRLLGVGSLAMAVTLVMNGFRPESDLARAMVQLSALASAGLFYAAYAPPRLLRVWWRRPEEDAMRAAILELLTTQTADEVVGLLLPAAARLVGAREAWLVPHGEAPRAPGFAVPMRAGHLMIATSPYAPVFGDEELSMFSSLAVMADLALERNQLLESEQAARSEAERIGADLEQFAYAASHDLKEPLRLLTGFSKVLNKRYGEQLDESAVDILLAIQRSTERMHQLIDDLLELSRVGRADLALHPTDLLEPLEEALENLEPAIEEVGAHIEIDALPMARCDTQLVALVFQNLVSNALKYHGNEPPRVRVSGHRRNGVVEVQVADRGEGIDPKYRDRIFAPFQRLHGGDGPEGTGIGLAVVKKVVELHTGEVWVESAPGEGATFCFTLPAADA